MSKFRIFAYTYLLTMLALLFAPLVARAQALPSLPATGFPYSQVGNAYTFTGGTTTAANAASLTFSNAANGAVYAQSAQSLPLGGGYSAQVTAKAVPGALKVSKALATFAAKVATPLNVGVAIYDLAKELGFTLDRDVNGAVTVQTTGSTPQYCRSASCYGSYDALAAAYKSPVDSYAWFAEGTYPGWVRYRGSSSDFTYTSTPGGSPQPATLQNLEDQIASKSGWPSGSAIGRALMDAVAAGEPLELPAPSTVTGPATVPMAPTITTFPDGSQDTVTPQKKLDYSPSGVTVTDRTITTHTSPGGVTTTIQDTASPAPLPEPAAPAEPIEIETCGLPGKPMCAVDGAGAPTGENIDDTGAKKTLDPIGDFLENPTSLIPDFPAINWSFALPTSCTAIPVSGALSTFLESIDVCQFQPMFHEIMSVVWMLGGLFGAISLFMRSALSD